MPDARVEAGVSLPRLGLGTWAWGDRTTWGMHGYDRSYGVETIREAYRESLAAGVTLFDTAEAYGGGESERILGRLLEEDRDLASRAVVATKFIPYPWRLSVRSSLLASLRASLDRLRLPFVHLYQIHGPISWRSHEAMADALAAAVEAGLAKAVGVSNYSEAEMRAVHEALSRRGRSLASNQIEYSLLRTRPGATGLLRACRELGIAVLAYSPLAQGRLTGKYGPGRPPKGSRRFSAYPMDEIEPVLAQLRRVGEAHGGKSPAQVALNWLIAKGAVPIPGAKTGDQARQNAGALGWQLSDVEIDVLDGVAKGGQRRLMHRIWQHG